MSVPGLLLGANRTYRGQPQRLTRDELASAPTTEWRAVHAPLNLVASRVPRPKATALRTFWAVLQRGPKSASILHQSSGHSGHFTLKGTSREDRRSQP